MHQTVIAACGRTAGIIGHNEEHVGHALGGTIRDGHHGFDCAALRLTTPRYFSAGAGNTFELENSVEFGEPGTP